MLYFVSYKVYVFWVLHFVNQDVQDSRLLYGFNCVFWSSVWYSNTVFRPDRTSMINWLIKPITTFYICILSIFLPTSIFVRVHFQFSIFFIVQHSAFVYSALVGTCAYNYIQHLFALFRYVWLFSILLYIYGDWLCLPSPLSLYWLSLSPPPPAHLSLSILYVFCWSRVTRSDSVDSSYACLHADRCTAHPTPLLNPLYSP